MAYRNIKSSKLFKMICIYGMLLDYKANSTTMVLQLELDFVARRSKLTEANQKVSINDSFDRLTRKLKERCALVPK